MNGESQPFDRNKIIRTALRMRATPEEAEEIAQRIEEKIYSGIPTKKIMQMLFSYMRDIKPHLKRTIDLREAIGMLRSKPDFEQFVAQLLLEEGYDVSTNQIVQGRCVEHEIDVIASKPGETIYVEVKHHDKPHTFTGIDVFLETHSVFEDLREGFKAQRHGYNFKKSMVAVNTKISEQARRYADCVGTEYLAWRAPENRGLEFLIEQKKLYPITFLRTLNAETQARLGDNGIVTVKQLVEENFKGLQRKTKIPAGKLRELISGAQNILQNQ